MQRETKTKIRNKALQIYTEITTGIKMNFLFLKKYTPVVDLFLV